MPTKACLAVCGTCRLAGLLECPWLGGPLPLAPKPTITTKKRVNALEELRKALEANPYLTLGQLAPWLPPDRRVRKTPSRR